MKPLLLSPKHEPDFVDFFLALKRHRVNFILVGAHAVMAHTQVVRATKDIDIYVSGTEENLTRLVRALLEFGAPPDVCSKEALRPGERDELSGVTFGVPPRRIDMMTKMQLPFEQLSAGAVAFDLAGHSVPVASVADLIALKELAVKSDPRRKQDRADLKALDSLARKTRLPPRTRKRH